jgi:hypothetical protein
MRTSMMILAALVLVPSVSFADETRDTDSQPAPKKTAKAAPAEDSESSPEDTGGYVTPHAVPYQGGKIPEYASIESRPNVALVATGIGILGASYLGSVIYGLATCSAQGECRAGSGWMYVPVIGPFITATQAPTTGGAALAMFDGGIQVVGAALAITGLVWQKKFVVWQSKSAALKVTPDSGSSGGPAGAVSGGVSFTLTHL